MRTFKTVEEYVEAAVGLARFEKLEEGNVYTEIPGFRGVWAEGQTRAQAKAELHDVLEAWIELRIERGLSLPEVRGMRPQVSFA